jgi:3-demethylubiquinone-9 3-methyltransferase
MDPSFGLPSPFFFQKSIGFLIWPFTTTIIKTDNMQKITPFLWFDSQAEEAVNFYLSIFPDGRIGSMARYGDAGPGPKGQVMTASFTIMGQEFVALNGGPILSLPRQFHL